MTEYIVEFDFRSPYSRLIHEEIVRCRDCKWLVYRGMKAYCDGYASSFREVSLDDFCSNGERRDA